MLGSAAIDLAWVAEGRLDASIILANKPWDTAAGVVIAREAGAHVVDQTVPPHLQVGGDRHRCPPTPWGGG
jgi:myo-inositol-1(or 4)-monophosphatase